MPELLTCANCGRRVSSEAARNMAGRVVCPPCVPVVRDALAAEKARTQAAGRQARREPVPPPQLQLAAPPGRQWFGVKLCLGGLLVVGLLGGVFGFCALRRRGRFGSLEAVLQDLQGDYRLRPSIQFDPENAATGVVRGREFFEAKLYMDASKPAVGSIYFDRDRRVRALGFALRPEAPDRGLRWRPGKYMDARYSWISRLVQDVSGKSIERPLWTTDSILRKSSLIDDGCPVGWRQVPPQRGAHRPPSIKHFETKGRGFTVELIYIATPGGGEGRDRLVTKLLLIILDGSEIW